MYDRGQLPLRPIRRVHFVGIGGAGMSGIAEVMLDLGYSISGSDLSRNRMTKHLTERGVDVMYGHAAENVHGADVVVYSSAVDVDNVELAAAEEHRIPVVRRAEMLAELMRFREGIAIAGTHGKTTTTSLVAAVLGHAGLDPTFVIGGLVKSVDTHARLGTGRYLVAEADESDASFLRLNPLIAVLTNVDADHMETYDGDFQQLRSSFVEFFQRLPFYGVAIVCADDEAARSLLPEMHRQVVTYGFAEDADIRAIEYEQHGPQSHLRVRRPDVDNDLNLVLNLPGRHNAQNALAAVAVARELEVDDTDLCAALASFEGIGRRCQVYGESRIAGVRVGIIDDYAHHPRELAAIIETVQLGWPSRRLLVVFQPHRYSRTRDLFEDFVDVLSTVDHLLVMDVYPAGEAPIPGADSRSLCRALRMRGKVEPVFVATTEQLPSALESLVQDDDLLLLLGAGSIGRVAEQFEYSERGRLQ